MSIGESFGDVLAGAKAQDRDAFEAIYRDVAPLVIGYLRSNRVRDSEDLAGEVFVTVVQRIADFEGDEHHFRSWLLTICHRRMVDSVRRAKRRPEDLLPLHDLARHARKAASGECLAMDRLQAGGIVDAIGDLSELQRAALTLRVLADLSIRDVAKVMGKPESAVKALLRRASASMTRSLDQVVPVS